MDMTPDEFVKELQEQKLLGHNRDNFYRTCESDYNEEARIKSKNLLLYLQKMISINPKILLVGEAPGYKGCKRTGIPFTSEYQIQHDDFFKRGFEVLNPDNPERENSAAVIWKVIGNARQTPLLWNIYPFHPFTKEGKNGKPNKKDIALGHAILDKLLTMFEIEAIYCIGRKSEQALKDNKLFKKYIRHPSHGGSTECRTQLEEILN